MFLGRLTSLKEDEIIGKSTPKEVPIHHRLPATPQTIHWGYFSSQLKPVLKIEPGDLVTVESPHGNPAHYEAAGIAPDRIPQSLKDIYREVEERGPGPHILVGPIYINGAEPGDQLEVHLKEINITSPFGFNLIVPGAGVLAEEFPRAATRILSMDLKEMISESLPGVKIPLRPFWGTLGVAPPEDQGKVSSGPPGIFGGNLDNKEFTSGTIVYLPVHVKGALFSAGDGHAVQGDGEANGTALEAEMEGTFQFFLKKRRPIKWPRAETPTHFITMGLHRDLHVAAKLAVEEMVDYLEKEQGIRREDAYCLTSLAVDLRVTQCVSATQGIHAMLPKRIFKKGENNPRGREKQ